MLLVCFLAVKSRVSSSLCVFVPHKHHVFQVQFMGSVFYLEALLCGMLGTYQSKGQHLAAAMSFLEPLMVKEMPRIAAKNRKLPDPLL